MNKELQFLIYNTPTESITIDVVVKDETIWLSQKAMGILFSCSVDNIALHLKNIYQSEELIENRTSEKFSVVQKEGNRNVTREMFWYNLDAIISVGYRVNSSKATQFRIWATKTLKEFITKGFVLDDVRLKQGQSIYSKDLFQELLERIRSIRASERRIYQQITDIFAECCIDYYPNSKETNDFFAMIQNKFHFAITGKTASELIFSNVDRNKENMGLKTWKNSPSGRILKSDVNNAKNVLSIEQIKELERTISGYFDYLERLIENKNSFTMKQFMESVDKYLNFLDYKILHNRGTISREEADKKAFQEYEEFNKTQKILSDFDKQLSKKK